MISAYNSRLGLVSHIESVPVLVSLLFLALIAPGCRGSEAPAAGEPRTLRIASTTSVENTGLLALLVEPFSKQYGVTVQVLAVGSGQALKLAANGDVDMVITHDPDAERAFIEQGHGLFAVEVMYNDFVLIGPSEDPAGVRGAPSAAEALARVASRGAQFVSRGDRSGTHLKELSLWKANGVSPGGAWYVEAGQGQRLTLEMADQKGAYVLVDRATYEVAKKKLKIVLLYENKTELHNPYSAMVVSSEKHPEANVPDGMAFIGWLLSSSGRKTIGEFRADGAVLFIPVGR